LEVTAEYDLALEEFQKCLEMKKNDFTTLYNMACCYSHKKDTDNALKFLDLSVDSGMIDFNHMQQDNDLEFARSDEKFTKIIEKQKQMHTK
jgi:tetratricopeptide (TPR) repeat protein